MSFTDAIKAFYVRYIDFSGRSSRSEYWWVMLFYLITITLLVIFVAIVTELTGGSFENDDFGVAGGLAAIPAVLFVLGSIIPMFAVTIRRFHDLNQTGWLVLLFNILGSLPIIGILAALGQVIWFCFPGTNGPNKYGDDTLSPNMGDIFD